MITNATELRETYLTTYGSFAVSPSDIAELDSVGNVRFARELLGTLVQAGLITESEGDEGTVWQTVPTYDEMDETEAEARIDAWLNDTTKENTMNTATKTRPAANTKDEGFHACYCGCGENVPAKSYYRPGHDARHAGMIGRLVAEDKDESHFNDLPSERLVLKAKGITIKALEKQQAKIDREAAREEAKAAKTGPEFVEGTLQVGKNERIGRKFKDGKIEYMDAKGEWKPASKAAAATFEE
jgi:hypothetical protein